MKLLFVDSDPVARADFQRAVQADAGCDVVSVEDFEQAWAALMEAEQPFDVLFAEPGPLNGPGFEWLRQIRTGSWHRPVSLVLCFAPDPAMMARAVEIGVRHFVFKPCTPRAIADKLAQIERARAYFQFEPAGSRV